MHGYWTSPVGFFGFAVLDVLLFWLGSVWSVLLFWLGSVCTVCSFSCPTSWLAGRKISLSGSISSESDIPQKVRTAAVNVQGSVPYSMHYLRMLYFRFVLNSVRDLLRYRCFGTHKWAPQPSCTLLVQSATGRRFSADPHRLRLRVALQPLRTAPYRPTLLRTAARYSALLRTSLLCTAPPIWYTARYLIWSLWSFPVYCL